MNSRALIMKKDLDVRQWISPIKLSYTEVCTKFGIDIENDRRNAFFWNILLEKQIVVSDDLLAWCGYSGEYKNMKIHFLSLLKKNTHMKYYEIDDQQYRKKRYVVMDSLDFESLLMQMRSRKAQEIRELYSFLKHISTQYMKYEKYFEEHRNELISHQNHQLTQSVHELKDLVLQVKDNADKEIERAEKERERAEKRHCEISDKLHVIKKRIRIEVVDKLRVDVAPMVSPAPINANKERCLGLICLDEGREWYIVRRQRESFNKAIGSIIRKNHNAVLVKEWHGVPHAVDVGNALKLRLRHLKWFARGNILRVVNAEENDECITVAYTNDDLIINIENILKENVAVELSTAAESIVHQSSQ